VKAARPRRATLPLPDGADGAGVAVTPMLTGEMLAMPHFLQRPSGPFATLRGLGLLTPRRRWSWVPIPAFLVEHPTAGPILVDTGLAPGAADDPARVLGRRAAIAFDIRMQEGSSTPERLGARGIDPHEVRLVVMTHLHYDHTGAVAAYPNATFVVDATEWDAAGHAGLLRGYLHRLYDHPFDWRTLDFGAHDVTSFASFGRTIDLLGDGSVRLLSTPGHSKGHMSVLLRLGSGRELLLTADAAFARRSIDEELVPTLCEDTHLYLRSLHEIRRYLELTPSALVICGHDAEGWPAVRDRYD
jgi:N-acyl homoserine lactone hydrolase